ncbi:MAG: adenylate/guanylate cyclase domain-containing protein [Pseudomonadota bacterium]|nr:adenylate/guanylate cyclase domain-containing protein [Pseudomonadota bacterium]
MMETERVEELHGYEILDTDPEFAFDDLTEFASKVLEFPYVFINLIDANRQWAISAAGMPREAAECDRDDSLCNLAIQKNVPLIIPDAQADDRFSGVGCVCNPPNVRFYAGMPLINGKGYALGTVCVVDFEPREFPYDKVELLKSIARQVVAQFELKKTINESLRSQGELEKALDVANSAKQTSEQFLRNIFPTSIAEEWLSSRSVAARYHDGVTIGFTDFVNFTKNSEIIEPAELVNTLNSYFSIFDEICSTLGIEKLKTVGDSYMFAVGLPDRNRHHGVFAALAALLFTKSVAELNVGRSGQGQQPWAMRMGLNSGAAMAGVVGTNKFVYDIWGDTVNVASRFEETGQEGKINISESTYYSVREYFECEDRGEIEIKNKGRVKAFWLCRLKPEYSADELGFMANKKLFAILGFGKS